MKYALVIFKDLLGSKPFVVYTDHAYIRTATQSPHLSQRMARWLSFCAEYNFEVKYEPGGKIRWLMRCRDGPTMSLLMLRFCHRQNY